MLVTQPHPIQRKLAEAIIMNTNIKGELNLSDGDIQHILRLLRKNLEYVRQYDELCSLSFIAHDVDPQWVQEICIKIDALEDAHR